MVPKEMSKQAGVIREEQRYGEGEEEEVEKGRGGQVGGRLRCQHVSGSSGT